MPSITALGVGSGLEIGSLVSQLVAAEAEPANKRLDRREAGYQAQISGLGALKSALSELQAALEGLKATTSFKGTSVTSANPERFTASASGDAAPGRFSIEVVQLASAQKLRSQGFSDEASAVGTGSLTISVGETAFSVTIDESNNTLAGIRDAINSAADNTGVAATIVNVDGGSGGTESRLVLTSEHPGSSSVITVAVKDDDGDDSDDAGLSRLTSDHLIELDPAKDAQITIDGQIVTRSSNTISDAIDGVTIELLSEAPEGEGPADLRLSQDNSVAGAAINKFVEGFNTLVDVLNQIASYDADTGQAGSLFGDSAVRNVEFQLRRLLGSRLAESGSIQGLADIGITTDDTGKLSVDSATLDRAIQDDVDAVAVLFAGDDGLAGRLDRLVAGYVDSGGIIEGRTTGLTDRIEDISDRREALNRRLTSLEERLMAQFSAMDALVGQLQATGNYLEQQFTALSNLTTQRQS
jgi:flagellar hook-associated protein 2